MTSTIAIVGLGYVGLPLAMAFGKTNSKVMGFDISEKRIQELKQGKDKTGECSKEQLQKTKVSFTADPNTIKEADYIIVAVPTPVHEKTHTPDLSYVESATSLVAKNMKKGSIIIYESTVYPGVTEEVCIPILEKISGLKCPKDFKVGYSPERISPGDKLHTLEKIVKIVSGIDKEALKKIAILYKTIIKAGVYEAPSIKVAEAAKVIENTQRDVNIGMVNELALIFDKMNLDTKEVLKAAGTKWNFHKYQPGLVGGHCISVDPHYLIYKAKQLGYEPKVITAGRMLNEEIPKHIAKTITKKLEQHHIPLQKAKVLILGLTFKENCKDTRNSKVKEIAKELKKEGIEIYGFDPLLDENETAALHLTFKEIKNLKDMDAIIFAVPHTNLRKLTIKELANMMGKTKILFDIKAIFDKEACKQAGIDYQSL